MSLLKPKTQKELASVVMLFIMGTLMAFLLSLFTWIPLIIYSYNWWIK